MSTPFDIPTFIRANLALQPAPMLPELSLYLAHAGSGLSRLESETTPYWAFLWPGGAVLARYILDYPQIVSGKRVLDIGTGSGIVAMAAKKAGAAHVIANDIDAYAIAAVDVNAGANDLAIETRVGDVLDDPPEADIIVIGDLFYHEDVARRVAALASGLVAQGKTVLAGDIGRAHLPHAQLELLRAYDVPDFGERRDTDLRTGAVYRFTR